MRVDIYNHRKRKARDNDSGDSADSKDNFNSVRDWPKLKTGSDDNGIVRGREEDCTDGCPPRTNMSAMDELDPRVAAAIKRFYTLRRSGILYRAAVRKVAEETGINLGRIDFRPYVEAGMVGDEEPFFAELTAPDLTEYENFQLLYGEPLREMIHDALESNSPISKQQAQYTPHAPVAHATEQCFACSMYGTPGAPEAMCSMLKKLVLFTGHCDFFDRRD